MEGWKIEIAKKEQANEILEFLLKYFREDEPISRSLGMTRDDAYELFKDLVEEGLTRPISFVCLNDKNEIVGCRLNVIVHLKNKETNPNTETRKQYPAVAQKIERFLEEICKDLPKLIPECKTAMKFNMVSVHPNYQRRGIAKKFIEFSMDTAKSTGCDYITTAATAFNSQQMFNKLGFETLRVIEHKDFCENGEQIFKTDDGTDCGKLMVKKIL